LPQYYYYNLADLPSGPSPFSLSARGLKSYSECLDDNEDCYFGDVVISKMSQLTLIYVMFLLSFVRSSLVSVLSWSVNILLRESYQKPNFKTVEFL
jgi:hypothetical protein